jgi:hypothetical protein
VGKHETRAEKLLWASGTDGWDVRGLRRELERVAHGPRSLEAPGGQELVRSTEMRRTTGELFLVDVLILPLEPRA